MPSSTAWLYGGADELVYGEDEEREQNKFFLHCSGELALRSRFLRKREQERLAELLSLLARDTRVEGIRAATLGVSTRSDSEEAQRTALAIGVRYASRRRYSSSVRDPLAICGEHQTRAGKARRPALALRSTRGWQSA